MLVAMSANAQWVQIDGIYGGSVRAITFKDNIILAGTSSGVFRSTDNGTIWTQTNLNNVNVLSLAINGNNVFAGTTKGIYLSTNNCASWTQTGLSNQYILCLLTDGNNIFAGTLAVFIFQLITV